MYPTTFRNLVEGRENGHLFLNMFYQRPRKATASNYLCIIGENPTLLNRISYETDLFIFHIQWKFSVKENLEIVAKPKHSNLMKYTAIVLHSFHRKTQHKQLTARFQFPEEYPEVPILIELVSRIMSHKLLDGLGKVCEEEAKKLQGQRQVWVEF